MDPRTERCGVTKHTMSNLPREVWVDMVGGSTGLDLAGCRQGGQPSVPRQLLRRDHKGWTRSGAWRNTLGANWYSRLSSGEAKGGGRSPSAVNCSLRSYWPVLRIATLLDIMFESRQNQSHNYCLHLFWSSALCFSSRHHTPFSHSSVMAACFLYQFPTLRFCALCFYTQLSALSWAFLLVGSYVSCFLGVEKVILGPCIYRAVLWFWRDMSETKQPLLSVTLIWYYKSPKERRYSIGWRNT